ncbi:MULTISPECIES: hypothetical protein [unclassified Streptomyces]|uniref:hypothetical protein n=1 Tax=unclassified Streptomyces TaxID=2593676 RepID=UPI00093B1D7E|nr:MULTISPECIES: hypothetical protein [unclassified Streptomyces]MBT2381133.1 hypothetical protein [Streptomyces sp. ISL-111]
MNATEAGKDGEGGPLTVWQRHISHLLDGAVPADVRAQIDTLRETIAQLALTRPLAAVAAAAQVERTGAACLQHVVATATATGRSWGEIGSAMGITRQAAHSRFAKTSRRG